MKKSAGFIAIKLIICALALAAAKLQAQNLNYMRIADSCMKLKDYACAATNYDLALEKIDPESNGIAYMAAVAWAKTADKDKTFKALDRYVKNNALNNYTYYSDQLLKEKAFGVLYEDGRWKTLIASVKANEAQQRAREKMSLDSAKTAAAAFEHALDVRPQMKALLHGAGTYKTLKTLFIYGSPKTYLVNDGITLFIRVDTTDVPFYVKIPPDYNPSVACPAVVVLHGAVRTSTGYGDARYFQNVYHSTSEHIPAYTKNYIAVYPFGTKTINWMTTESGFDMVNRIVMYLKAFLNIDDNRMELLGHSNGATGVFTYLIKSPTLYAGFYGMNTQPRVYIGCTFLKNGVTRHFYDFTTDKDYYYPFAAVQTIDSLAKTMCVDWHTQVNHGYPHWFPSMKEAFEPMGNMFADMANRVRNPYPKRIYFETDNIKYGTSDWITITKLDTLTPKAAWQTAPNFKITEWPDNRDFNKIVHREEWAFNYPHSSGAVNARREGNKFYIETSDVASFSIKLNREVIDYRKKVTVYVNGKKRFSGMLKPDGVFILKNFKENLDRKVIWENEINLNTN